jgi:multiple sugar transport system substrate-binding protein
MAIGMSRRQFLQATGGAAALVLGGGRRAGAQWTLPAGPVTATFWDSTSALKTKLYTNVILPSYKQLRPNYTVKYESITTGNLLQKLLAATSTGTAPEIFELGDWFFPTYFGRDILDPIPPEAFGHKSLAELLDSYLPGSLAAMQHEGKLYGLPDFVASHSLHINNRLFREAGLDPVKDAPKTWDDVARLNKVLTRRRDGQVVQKGFEFRYTDEHWIGRTFHHLIYQAGGEVLDREGRPVFNQEPGVRALEVWRNVTTAPKVSKNTGASPFHDFATEQDAMSYIGPNGQKQSENINPAMKDNITVVPLPQINPAKPATMAFAYVIVVNARVPDERKRVAWDFVRHTLGDPRIWLANNGSLLPQRAWATSAEARKLLPFYDVFVQDIAIGKPLARTRHFAELQGALSRMVERVILNNAEPRPALDQAAAEYERAAKA